MDDIPLKVLLLGENQGGWACLHKQLQKRGCRCRCARSPEQALELDGAHAYDLILSSMPVAQMGPFLVELGDAHANAFYCHPVEDGCWWLPVVRHGRNCFGAPGARGGEFMTVLDQIIRDTRSEKHGKAEPVAESEIASAAHA